MSVTVGSLPLSKHSGGGRRYTSLLLQACFFTVCLGKCFPTLWQGVPLFSLCWMPSPLQACWVGPHPHLLLQACLFTVCMEKCPSPILWQSMPHREGHFPLTPELRAPCPLCYIFFSIACLLFSCWFFFFAVQRLVCPGGYAGFSQGWLWEYCVTLVCSPAGLPSRLRASAWRLKSPPGFPVYHDVGELGVGCGCGGVEVLPLLCGFSFLVCLQHLRKIFI
jgi:hypothetical protein